MLLTKEVAVELNLTHCKLKQFMATMLKLNNIDLTPEQFLLIDLLWNQGSLSQQQLADMMQKDKNSITKLIDAIEQKGYVVRKQNPTDRHFFSLLHRYSRYTLYQASGWQISMVTRLLHLEQAPLVLLSKADCAESFYMPCLTRKIQNLLYHTKMPLFLEELHGLHPAGFCMNS